MVKYCPSCGTRLEQEFNFCPSCGFDLRNIAGTEPEEKKNQEPSVKRVVVCDNCGEENDEGNNICSYCGAPLKGAKIERVSRSGKLNEEKKPAVKKVKASGKSQTGMKISPSKSAETSTPKELNQKKLLLILAGVVVVVFIILYSSGILNSTEPDQVTQNQVSNQSSGVDLNNVQRINELEEKVKNNPEDTDALLELAHLRNDSGMYDKAIVDYQKYLEKVPKDPDARIDMGVCYYNLKNYDEAIKQMKLAVKYSPKHQIGYLNLGIVNLAAGNIEKSREWLQQAVQLDPNTEMGKRAQELLDSHTK
jgi:TolA-binding protein